MPMHSSAHAYGSIPELMRVARGSYKRAIDERLVANGLEDLPNPGGYLLTYLAAGEESIPERIAGLGIGGRELSELTDALVMRGFVTREIDPTSGTASFALTERGRAASDAIDEGAQYVDDELARRLTSVEMAGLRRGLTVLGEIKGSLSGPSIRRGLSR